MDNLDSGALFANKKRGEKDPDFTGMIDISPDLLEKLLVKRNRGEELKLRVAGWKNTARDGKGYLRLRIKEDDQRPQQNTQQYQKPAYQQRPQQAPVGYGAPQQAPESYPGKAPWDV